MSDFREEELEEAPMARSEKEAVLCCFGTRRLDLMRKANWVLGEMQVVVVLVGKLKL